MAIVVGDGYAAYRAISIDGVRTLERGRIAAQQIAAARETLSNRLLSLVVNQPDRRIAADGVRGLMREQRARYIELAEHAAGVRAIDGGLRKTREALVSTLLRDAHDLDHFAAAEYPANSGQVGRRFDEADRLLDQQRRRWGLTPLLHDHDAKLTAADDEFAHLARPNDQPVDATLVLRRDKVVIALDLRTGTETQLGAADDFPPIAIGNGFVAISQGRTVDFIDAAEPANPAKRGFYGIGPRDSEYHVVTAHDRESVWVQDQAHPNAPVVRVDRNGQAVETRHPQGQLVADLGDTIVWTELYEHEPATYRIEHPGGVLVMRCECDLDGAVPNALLWRPMYDAPYVSSYEGTTRLELEADPLGFRGAALSPDGTRLAVGWYDGRLQIIDIATGAAAHTVRTPGIGDIRWTPSGDRIFFTVGTSHGWYRPGDADINYLRVRRSGTLLLGVF